MTDKQYRIFQNKCDFCGCEQGEITYQWGMPDNPEKRAYLYGHKMEHFHCSAYGAITIFEIVPVIYKVVVP